MSPEKVLLNRARSKIAAPPLVASLTGPRRRRQAVSELGRANKHDVELAKVERSRVLIEKVGDVATVVLSIVAFAAPIWAVSRIVGPLAGRETTANIDINVALTVTLSATLVLSVVVNAAQWVRGRGRRRELKRQRAQLSELEGRLLVRDKSQRQ